jgi:low affinity Fe/Cu permease
VDHDAIHTTSGSARHTRSHAKLDELWKATHDARTELASIDESEPEVIEKIRDRERREAQTK